MLNARRRAAQRRPGPAAHRIRRRRDRRPRQPRRGRARRLHARASLINILSATLPRSDPGSHADVRVPARDRDARLFQPNGLIGTVEKLRRKRVCAEVPRVCARKARRDGRVRARRGSAPDDLDAARPLRVPGRHLGSHHRDRQRSSTTTRPRSVPALLIVLGLQMFSGNSGILSFGQMAFMAVGAYTSALLTIPTAIKQFTFVSMPQLAQGPGSSRRSSARSRGRSPGGVAAHVVAMVSACRSSAWSAWRRASRRSRCSSRERLQSSRRAPSRAARARRSAFRRRRRCARRWSGR